MHRLLQGVGERSMGPPLHHSNFREPGYRLGYDKQPIVGCGMEEPSTHGAQAAVGEFGPELDTFFKKHGASATLG